MTYQDPKIPDPGLGRNPPRYRDLDTDSYYTGSIIALILGTVLIGGVILYGVSDLSTTPSNPPTTTGQGGAQMAPAPAVPFITLPPIDQNVPAEKIAPPIPSEPRIDN